MTLTSQYAGKCKVCGKEWKVGNEIWYQRDPVKCICIDEQCFEKQKGGTGTAAAPAAPTARTESERTEDCKHMIEILWGMASAKALEVIRTEAEPEERFWENRDRLILAEVFYKSLTYNWMKN